MDTRKSVALAQIFYLFANKLDNYKSETNGYADEMRNFAFGLVLGKQEKLTGHLSDWGCLIQEQLNILGE